MIKHIVFFKFTEKLSKEERLKSSEAMKKIFSPLLDLPSVEGYKVGINISASDNAWDVVIDSTFKSLEKLKEYSISAEHQAAIKEAKVFKKEKSVVDYEF